MVNGKGTSKETNMGKLEELKKIRSSLSCTLSSLRKDVRNPNLTESQLKSKLERGIKVSTKYVEVSEQLCELGLRCEYKVPHMRPEWWKSFDPTKPDTVESPIQLVCPKQSEMDIVGAIREAIKSELRELKIHEETNNEYELNLAWTTDIGEKECVDNLLSIISEYLDSMEIRSFRKERYDNECIDVYIYSGNSFDVIKQTIQFMIDRWGEGTNVSVYGKQCKS